MARSDATSVSEYLKSLPHDRGKAISAVRDTVRKNLPKGYQESMDYGMISWEIPLEEYPHTYNKKPLVYAALASQKNHMALYLMSAYSSDKDRKQLEEGFRKAGKKLDVGKSCIRFKSLDDLPLDAIGKVIASTPPDEYIKRYEKAKKK